MPWDESTSGKGAHMKVLNDFSDADLEPRNGQMTDWWSLNKKNKLIHVISSWENLDRDVGTKTIYKLQIMSKTHIYTGWFKDLVHIKGGYWKDNLEMEM